MSNIILAILVGFLVGGYLGLEAQNDAIVKYCDYMHSFRNESTVYDCQVRK